MVSQYQKRAVQLVNETVPLIVALRRTATYKRYLVAVMES